MDTKTALTFAAYYHVVALCSSALGLAIALAALAYGIGGAFTGVSLMDPTTYFSGMSPAGAGVATAGVAVGLLVRRIGKTAARLKVQTEAVERDVTVPSTSDISQQVGDDVSADVLEVVETVVDVDDIEPEADGTNPDGTDDADPQEPVVADPKEADDGDDSVAPTDDPLEITAAEMIAEAERSDEGEEVDASERAVDDEKPDEGRDDETAKGPSTDR